MKRRENKKKERKEKKRKEKKRKEKKRKEKKRKKLDLVVVHNFFILSLLDLCWFK